VIGEERSSGLVKQKIALEDKMFRTQINGKFNDICTADENKYKYITVEPLFKNYKKAIHLFIDRRLRSCTCF
jgi:hypothetical protein